MQYPVLTCGKPVRDCVLVAASANLNGWSERLNGLGSDGKQVFPAGTDMVLVTQYNLISQCVHVTL